MRVFKSAVVIVPFEGKRIHAQAGHIGDFTLISLRQLTMAKGSQVNSGVKIIGGGDFELGEFSTVGYNVVIVTGTDTPEGKVMNDYAAPELRYVIQGSVRIGRNCFIGSNSVVTIRREWPHIEIGDNSVVMALSYVDRSIPPNMVYGKFGSEEISKPRF